MQKGKIIFTGNFWEYLLVLIFRMIISILIFGAVLLYSLFMEIDTMYRVGLAILAFGALAVSFFYSSFRYFFTKLEIEMYG